MALTRSRRTTGSSLLRMLAAGCLLFVLAGCVPRVMGQQQSVSWWRPKLGSRVQVQLQGVPDLRFKADAYEFDAVDVSSSTVTNVHARGARAICYVDAGTWEQWRPDAGRFPASVLGSSDGWPGERWLDIRRWHVLGPILAARANVCARKGFDAIDFDNVDGYTQRTGFALTSNEQLAFNRSLAATAHNDGLAVVLKNDGDQAASLVRDFDLAIDEQCVRFSECSIYEPFVRAGKAVVDIEYVIPPSRFCRPTRALGIVGIAKHTSLDAWIATC